MKILLSRWPAVASAALAIFLAIACTSDGSRCTALPGGSHYCLQTTASIVSFDVQQKVNVVLDGRQETLIAQLEVDSDGMRFVGVTPFGQKLVQLTFDNDRVRVETSLLQGVDPILLLALVQVATWPGERVRAGLGDSALVDDAEGLRRLVKDGRDLVLIRYAGGRPPLGDMSIHLPGAGVNCTIESLKAIDTE